MMEKICATHRVTNERWSVYINIDNINFKEKQLLLEAKRDFLL